MNIATLSHNFLMLRSIVAGALISISCHSLHAMENHDDVATRIMRENLSTHRSANASSVSAGPRDSGNASATAVSPAPLKAAIIHEPKAALLGGLGLLLILRRRKI